MMPMFGLGLRAGFLPVESLTLAMFSIVLFVWYFGKHRQYLTLGAGWWLGWLFGFAYNYSCCFWLNELIRYNGLIPLAILLLGAIMALWFGLMGVAMADVAKRRPEWLPLATASSWTLFEWARGAGDLGFPFFRVAHLFWQSPAVASVWGELGITFAAVLLAGCGGLLLLRWWLVPGYFGRRAGLAWLAQAALGLLVLGSGWLFSTPGGLLHEQPQRLLLVQPNISQADKMAAHMAETREESERLGWLMAEKTIDLVKDLKPGEVDLVVMPEATFAGLSLQFDPNTQRRLFGLLADIGTPMLVGADNWVYQPPSTEKVFNAIYLLSPTDQAAQAIYRKRWLVPFGENVPYLDVIPYFAESIVGIGSFDRGKGAQNMAVSAELRAGMLLCFESAVGPAARESMRAGANVLVVMTNDAWFERSYGQYFHMMHGAFRAAETGLPLVQAANTGLTVVFDRTGRLIDSIPPHEASTHRVDLHLPRRGIGAPSPTIYGRMGDWWLWALVAALATLVALGRRGTPGPRLD